MTRKIKTDGLPFNEVRIKIILSDVRSIIEEKKEKKKKKEGIFSKDIKQNNHNIYFQQMHEILIIITLS